MDDESNEDDTMTMYSGPYEHATPWNIRLAPSNPVDTKRLSSTLNTSTPIDPLKLMFSSLPKSDAAIFSALSPKGQSLLSILSWNPHIMSSTERRLFKNKLDSHIGGLHSRARALLRSKSRREVIEKEKELAWDRYYHSLQYFRLFRINDLPFEVVTIILRHACSSMGSSDLAVMHTKYRLMFTCKLWRDIVLSDAMLWQTVGFHPPTFGRLIPLLERATIAVSDVRVWIHDVPDGGFDGFMPPTLYQELVREIPSKWRSQLEPRWRKRLNMENPDLLAPDFEFSESGIRKLLDRFILPRMAAITSLDLSFKGWKPMWKAFSQLSETALGGELPITLRHLGLRRAQLNLEALTEPLYPHYIHMASYALFGGAPASSLSSVILHGVYFDWASSSASLSNLTRLDLIWIPVINLAHFAQILASSPGLEHLNLEATDVIADPSTTGAPVELPKLEYLRLSNLNPTAITSFAGRFIAPNVRELTLANFSMLFDFTEAFGALSFPRVLSLTLDFLDIRQPEALQQLRALIGQMWSLSILSLSKVTFDFLKVIFLTFPGAGTVHPEVNRILNNAKVIAPFYRLLTASTILSAQALPPPKLIILVVRDINVEEVAMFAMFRKTILQAPFLKIYLVGEVEDEINVRLLLNKIIPDVRMLREGEETEELKAVREYPMSRSYVPDVSNMY